MTGETQKNKKHTNLHNSVVVAWMLAMLIPSIIGLVILFQLRLVHQEMVQMQEKMIALEEQMSTGVSMQENARGTQQAEELTLETSDEILSEDFELIENQLDIEFIEQNSGAWDANSGIRKVYLTFDDGPSTYTNQILDILDEYGVKATFFVVGKEGYTEEYQRIVKEGHTLGMHSFSHKYQEIYSSLDAYKRDLTKLHEFLFEITGVDSSIVRFPGGSSNQKSKVNMQELISYLNEQGMNYYDWNVSSGDASSIPLSANQIANNVLTNVWKYDSNIVLMHDSSAKYATVEALPIIIQKILESENTVLLPISEDTVPIQHIKAECQ